MLCRVGAQFVHFELLWELVLLNQNEHISLKWKQLIMTHIYICCQKGTSSGCNNYYSCKGQSSMRHVKPVWVVEVWDGRSG